ncbi:MAG: TetR/AcrR family transcriptional regulator [Acidimicrobiales bacterium]
MADSARADFLAAGGALLEEASVGDLLGRAITIGELCRRAGRSPGGFYHHWPGIEAYLRDLILASVDDANAAMSEHLFGALEDFTARTGASVIYERLRTLLSAYLETILTTPRGATAELIVWIADDPDLRRELAVRYGELSEVAEKLVPVALGAWGRELRPPWKTEDVVRGISVTLWGAQILDRLDPSPRYRRIAVDMAMSTIAIATRNVRSDLDGDDFLRLSLGVGRDGPASPWAERLRLATAPIIVDLHQRSGWAGVTLAAVAEVADEYIQDIDVAWRGRAGMAAAVWAYGVVPALRSALADDLAAPDPPGGADGGAAGPPGDGSTGGGAPDLLSRHVERLVVAVRNDVPVALTFLSLGLSRAGLPPTDPSPVDDLASVVQVTADAIGAARRPAAPAERVGGFASEDPVSGDRVAADDGDAALAATLTRMVITEAASRPGDDPAVIADHVLRLLGSALAR